MEQTQTDHYGEGVDVRRVNFCEYEDWTAAQLRAHMVHMLGAGDVMSARMARRMGRRLEVHVHVQRERCAIDDKQVRRLLGLLDTLVARHNK